MFNTTATENYDGINIPSLLPAKYENVKLVKVEASQTTKGDGSKGKKILTFLFQTADGKQHQHTEYDLDGDAKAADKLPNLLKRVGHIMSKFIPKERLAQANTTWDGYAAWVVATLSSVDYKNMPVDILITGNVYNKKATSGFRNFPPFIAKTGEQLNFDSGAELENKKYYDFKNSQSSPTPDVDNTKGPGGQSFSTDEVKADF